MSTGCCRPPSIGRSTQSLRSDLTFDALGFPAHMENFCRLFNRHPAMRAVIDHGLKPAIRRPETAAAWRAGIARLAAETTACCKLSGLLTEAGPGWTLDAVRPYVEHLIACFGPQRLMWGSDWPVLGLVATYEQPTPWTRTTPFWNDRLDLYDN